MAMCAIHYNLFGTRTFVQDNCTDEQKALSQHYQTMMREIQQEFNHRLEEQPEKLTVYLPLLATPSTRPISPKHVLIKQFVKTHLLTKSHSDQDASDQQFDAITVHDFMTRDS
jgi:hypothetical protein